MKNAKLSAADVNNFKPGLDDETISVLQKYVSAKSQSNGEDGGVKGKTNPFMPN